MILPAMVDFQYQMLLYNRFVDYCPLWIHASDTEHNSVRILPEVVHARDLTTQGHCSIYTVERLSPQQGNLLDVHISIQETVPYVTSERSRFVSDGQTAKIALQCVLSILLSAYSEKYIRDCDNATYA